MNIAMTTENGRVAPCFAGVELWIVEPNQGVGVHRIIHTAGRDPSHWARELVRQDVGVLLCAGIDIFVWGGLLGNGVEVVPDAIGTADDVLARWRAGLLITPPIWPPPVRQHSRRRDQTRRRFHGG